MIKPDPSAVFRQLEGGGVILNVETGHYYQVNATGRFIWESLQETVNDEALIEAVSSAFEIDRDRAETDTNAFIRALEERSLVTRGA